jgi:hypothetical protein
MLRWGLDFSYRRTGRGAFWVHRYCDRRSGDCQILVVPVSGGLPDFFCYWHIGG